MALLDVTPHPSPNHWLLLSNSREKKKSKRHLKSPLVDTEEESLSEKKKKLNYHLMKKKNLILILGIESQTFLHRISHFIHSIVPKTKNGQHSDSDYVRVTAFTNSRNEKPKKKKIMIKK